MVSIDSFTLDVKFDLLRVEDVVRRFWSERRVPERWRAIESSGKIFSFLEGPPTANGFPHAGHIRGRTYKDVVLRYHRLKGYSVWAQAGWDEQGLPVELEVEKRLGLSSKKDIERIGLDRFSEECNKLVDYYLKHWEEHGTRLLGLWLDLDRAYETRRPKYIEYVWKFIKEAWMKGLLYEGYRVLPYCPRCETALSDAEVDLGYEDREDPSIFVKFPVRGREDTYLVIWTTTPWTLVDNEAVAVHPGIRYARVGVRWNGRTEYWYLAENLVHALMGKFGVQEYEVVEVVRGDELRGLKYRHVLEDLVPAHREHDDRSHYVVTADFVSLERGTGLVHMAPAHGPEDFEVAQIYGIPITNSVNANGVFNESGGIFAGKYWTEVSKEVVEHLRRRGLLVHEETIVHKYPHCWRCHTPLIYRTDRQWFIKISALRDKLLEEIRRVKIYPEHLRDRFENWLANIRDWTISRSRVWGTPLPVWRCRDDESKILVVGSLDELKRYAKELPRVPELLLVHRPWIDMVKMSTDDCREWVREPYVVDVWLDSGVAWIASIDGDANKELFERLYPYDWITEAVDQTRGWFYSLLATSTLWRWRAPYKSVLIQGHVVDKHGQKMSKSKGNVIWARDLLERWGSDATRLYILTKTAPWDTMAFDPDEISESKRALTILWNVVKFADLYMSLDKFDPRSHRLEALLDKALPEDRWILSRFYVRLRRIEEHMSRYELHLASREWVNLVVEDLSHRYLRLVRRRVWTEEPIPEKYAAYAVLYHVIKGSLIVGSMFVPHITEYLWQSFIRKLEPNEAESVHLTRFPDYVERYVDQRLERAFDVIFTAFSDVVSLRNRVGIKLRWPIMRAIVYTSDKDLAEMLSKLRYVIEYLVNAKEVIISSDGIKCSEELECLTRDGYGVAIVKRIDRRLLLEAYARELVRRVQFMRGKMNLRVDERIRVCFDTKDGELMEAISEFRDYIMVETRATSIEVSSVPDGYYVMDWDIEDKRVRIGIARA